MTSDCAFLYRIISGRVRTAFLQKGEPTEAAKEGRGGEGEGRETSVRPIPVLHVGRVSLHALQSPGCVVTIPAAQLRPCSAIPRPHRHQLHQLQLAKQIGAHWRHDGLPLR